VRELFRLLVVKDAGAHYKPNYAPAAPCDEEEGSGEAQAPRWEARTARDA
jgi:hypothetical protein